MLGSKLPSMAGCVVGLGVVLASLTSAVSAATPGAGWAIQSVALPSNFSQADSESCENSSDSTCDAYLVKVVNVGAKPSEGPVVVKDALPPGLAVAEVARARDTEAKENLECSEAASSVECTDPDPVPPGDFLAITINVRATGGAKPSVTNEAEVEEGGTVVARTSAPSTVANTVDGEAPSFGVQDFSVGMLGSGSASDTQAGDHPSALTTTIDYTTAFEAGHGSNDYAAVADPKSEIVDLPLGFVGDPLAAEQCPESDLRAGHCPLGSVVGVAAVDKEGTAEPEKIYNMVPEPGYPALFAFEYVSADVFLRARVVPSPSGYMLSVSVPEVPRSSGGKATGAMLTFFGDPVEQDGGTSSPAAFFTNPTDCSAGPLRARVEMDSWVDPEQWVSKEAPVYETSPTQAASGCSLLQFDPTIELKPEETQADTPTGYEVDLKVPQVPNVAPDLATPDLKDAEVTLPEGVSVSPGAADGLVGCREVGPEGINITHDWTPTGEQPLDPTDPEAMEIAPDGLPHVARGHCPAVSQIGTAEITTPLLREKLDGQVYVAQPECEPCSEADAREGRMFGLYLEAEGSGIVIKLKGKVTVDPATGRLTTHFEETPQLPFSELKLRLKGGPRAPLANPQTCGEATTTSTLTPWSAPESGPPATPSSSFTVSGCASDPFNPSFLAQSEATLAGGNTPFAVQFSRNDGEQDLGGITVTTPPGLLGRIAGVPLCGEPQAQDGQCPSASQIGTATVAAGAGSHPFWLSGPVYLTGAYKGAPFGLSVVVPERAGPFDLGEEVVRSAIRIDPNTGQITVTSDPLPQIKDGVPFRLKTVNVTVNRPSFMFNPTNCEALRVNATISGEHPIGSSEAPKIAKVSSPFAAAGCRNLPFKPSFVASTQAKTSKVDGASLVVKVTQKPGEANIHRVDLELPLALPSRLSTLQKACTEAQFNANPAGCPSGSVIGTATAHTPVLQAPLTGPAYLVSHGGGAFPDVEFVLEADERGGNVEIVLDGKTQIKKGITYSHFETVPDAPISSFETDLPEGPHSILSTENPGSTNLCALNLLMPTTIVGQNGAELTQSTKIGVTGCARITITQRKLSGDGVALAFNLTMKGAVTVTGPGLKRYAKTLSAGSHQIKVAFSKAGLSMRVRHRTIKIKVALRSGTKTSSATTTIKL